MINNSFKLKRIPMAAIAATMVNKMIRINDGLFNLLPL